MGNFELPSLGDLDNKAKAPASSPPPLIEEEGLGEELIDINDLEDEYVEEQEDNSDFYEEISNETETPLSEIIKGTVVDVKFSNEDEELTVVKLEVDYAGLVYLRIPYLEYAIKQGMTISSQVDPDETAETSTGILVYVGYDINILSMPGNEKPIIKEDVPSSKPKSKKNKGNESIIDKIKNALAEAKSELKNPNKEDDKDYENEYDEDPEEQEPEQEERKPKDKKNNKPKKKSGIVTLYKTIANIIYSFIMKIIEFLGKIPLIGRVLGLLKVIGPVIKFLSLLWLPILIVILWGSTSLFAGMLNKTPSSTPDSVDRPKDSIVLKKDDTEIMVTKQTYDKGTVTVEFQNTGEMYADFYFELGIKEKKLFGKKGDCLGPITVSAPSSKAKSVLKCDIKPDEAKLKGIDITVNN